MKQEQPLLLLTKAVLILFAAQLPASFSSGSKNSTGFLSSFIFEPYLI